MAQRRFEGLTPERQRAILAPAAEEFAAHGYQGASLNRIIEAAGMSKGVFYYYFDDKADLAAALFEHAVRDVLRPLEMLELPKAPFDFWKLFQTILSASLEGLRASPKYSDAISRLGMAVVHDADLRARLQPAMRNWMRAAVTLWKRGQKMGAVRADLPAELLVTLLQGVKEALARVLLPADRAPTQRELERFLEMQTDLFRRVASPLQTLAPRRRRSATREESRQ